LDKSNLKELTGFCLKVRSLLEENRIRGEGQVEIDHIELSGSSNTIGVNAKNFVLCPGGEYDRSPCGTGTSAKLACLAADGKLEPGENWSQESIIGSVFDGSYQWVDKSRILPTITGSAYLSSRGELLWQEGDPFGKGI
jgi:proline racemase